MDAGSELEPLIGHMRDGDLSDGCHQIQSHLGDLVGMPVPVPLGQTAHHHVSVSDGLHLVRESDQVLVKQN